MLPKRANWSKESLASALDAVASGSYQRLAAKRFQIPGRTLRNCIESGKKSKKLGRNAILISEQVKQLCLRIIRFNDVGLPLTTSVVKSYVYEYCKANNIKHSFNNAKGVSGRK